MVPSPDQFDDNDLLGQLLNDDEENFREQYREEYEVLSDDEAKRAIREEFRSIYAPEHEVFKSVKNSFHPRNEVGYESEYEVSFTNPLYEIHENPADLLLTYTDWRNVNFCFVVCEVVSEDYARWPSRINEIYDLVTGHESYLKEQVDEVDKKINTIQYATATRKQDLPDIEFRHIEQQVAPENYALWVMDDDVDRDSPDDPPMLLYLEEGEIEHQKLRSVMEPGIDYEKSRNRDVIFSLHTHAIITLQETLMALVTHLYGKKDEEEPREFNRDDFEGMFIELCEVGPSGKEKREMLRDRAGELLKLAENADILYSKEHRRIKTSRDYRVRYPSGGTKHLKPAIKRKFIDHRAPHRRGQMAFDNTVKSFRSRGGLPTDFESSEWQDER